MTQRPRHTTDGQPGLTRRWWAAPWHRLHGDESGTSLTEFAITLPVFLIVLSGLLMLSDLTLDMNQNEAAAYRATMNATIEAERRDAHEAVAAGDNHQVNQSDTPGFVAGDLSEFPEKQPTDRPDFRTMYEGIYNPASLDNNFGATTYSLGQAAVSNDPTRMPASADAIQPFADNPAYIDSELSQTFRLSTESDFHDKRGGPTHQRLSGSQILQDRVHREHDPSAELDRSLAIDFFSIDDSGLENIASDLAVATGARYGVVSRDTVTSVEHENRFFDASADFQSYYSSGIPSHVPDNSAQQAEERAAATARWRMDLGASAPQRELPYFNMLQIDGLQDPLIPVEAEDDEKPRSADELFNGPLGSY